MVVTHTANLLVYRGTQLCWAAKMDTQAVAVAVSDFGGVRGMIVSLDDKGALVVAYLGTDPQTNPVGFSEVCSADSPGWFLKGLCGLALEKSILLV